MKPRPGFFLFVAMLALSGCAHRAPVAVPAGDTTSAAATLAIPLDVQELEVAKADGHRGVFLKLSRLPDAVEHHGENRPARIVIDIKGPTGGESPEQDFPGQDQLVSRIRVARTFGVLKVVLDLEGDRAPRYSVHAMADWIMIRIATDESSGLQPSQGHLAFSAGSLSEPGVPGGGTASGSALAEKPAQILFPPTEG